MNLSEVSIKIINQISTGKKVSGRLTNQIPESDYKELSKYSTDSSIAALYCIAKNITPTKCFCGNNTKFNTITTGFKQFCSVSCSLKYNNKKNNSIKNKISAEEKYNLELPRIKICSKQYCDDLNLKTIVELAQEHNISLTYFKKYLKENNLIKKGDIHKKRQNKKMIDNYPELFDNEFFNKEQQNNKNSKIVSKELGLSPNTICVYARKQGKAFTNKFSISLPEYELCEFFSNNEIIKNSKKIISPYEIDIFLPEYQLGIEYNGAYWHSEQQGKDKNYHINKQELAEKNNIKLIQIFDFEWLNRNDQIKGYLNSLTNKNMYSIFARKTTVKLIDKKTSSEFLELNHIHGNVNSKYNYGLYFNDELVSVLTLGKSRFSKKYDYEVLRYCNKIGVRVVGGLSKLISYIKSNLEFDTIVSYSHRRLFDGNSFLKAGFNLSHKTKPGYFWANKYSSHILPRYKTQKHKLNTELTEYEYMTSLGYVKIWDCGQLVFILENINS